MRKTTANAAKDWMLKMAMVLIIVTLILAAHYPMQAVTVLIGIFISVVMFTLFVHCRIKSRSHEKLTDLLGDNATILVLSILIIFMLIFIGQGILGKGDFYECYLCFEVNHPAIMTLSIVLTFLPAIGGWFSIKKAKDTCLEKEKKVP